MSKAEEALRKFGKDLIAHGDKAEDPNIEISPKVVMEMLDKAESGKGRGDLTVGICNVMWSCVHTHFRTQEQKWKDDLKSKLLALAKTQLESKAMEPLADTIVDVYRMSDNRWPELLNYIFESKPRNEMIGCVFVRFMATTNSAFQRQMSQKIISIIFDLIETVSIPIQRAMIVLLAQLCEQAFLKPEMFDKMWTALIHILTTDQSRSRVIYPPLELIYRNTGMFDKEPKAASTLLASIKDDWTVGKPLILLIPFLPGPFIQSLLEKLSNIALKQKKLGDLIDYICTNANLSDIPKETFEKLSSYFRGKAATDSSFAIYGALASVDGDVEVLEELRQRKSTERVVLALKVVGFMASSDFAPPDDVSAKVAEMMCEQDKQVGAAAFECMKSMISNQILSEADDIELIISKWDNIQNIDWIFDLLSLWATTNREDEKVQEVLFQVLYCAVTDESNRAKYAKGVTQMFVAMALSGLPEMMQAFLDMLLPTVEMLIGSKESESCLIGLRAMRLLIEVAPEEAAGPAKSLVEKVFGLCRQGADVEIKKESTRLLGAIVGKYQMKPMYSDALKLIQEYLRCKDPILVQSAAAICTYFVTEKKVYDTLISAAMTMKDHITFNKSLKALIKFVKHNKSCDGVPLAKALLAGTHPVFNRRPPSAISDTKTRIHSFLAVVKCEGVEETLLEWLNEAPTYMLSVFLIAFAKRRFVVKNYARWAKLFTMKMNHAPVSCQELTVELVMSIIREEKSAMDIHIFISQLLYLWNTTDHDEYEMRTVLATGMLELVSMGAELESQFVLEILSMFPFSECRTRCEDAVVSLLKIYSSGKWSSLNQEMAVAFASVLDYGSSDDNITKSVLAELTNALKSLCKSDAIRTEIHEQFPDISL